MRVLFIGGTGNISRACVRESIARNMDVFLLNRGNQPDLVPDGATVIQADIRDVQAARESLKGLEFDVVADFLAYTPKHTEAAMALFEDTARQYIFISSASVYHKPVLSPVISESTPAHNPFWEYARLKIACEQALLKTYATSGFPVTIVRPSHTYNDGWIPTSFGSNGYTVAARMLEGKEIIVHGDGQSLWTLTYAADFARGFVGLFGNPAAVGETFHITSDESLSWDAIHTTIASALGVEARIVHMPSDVIARLDPERGPGLLGDKAYSVIFDNSKIKRYVAGFTTTVPFHEGLRRSLAWFDARPERKQTDPSAEKEIESLLAAWNAGLTSMDAEAEE